MQQHNFMQRLLLAGGISLNLYLLLYLTTGVTIPTIAQTIHLAHWITGSAGLLLPLYLYFLPKRIYSLILVFPLLMFLGWYGGHFIPKTKPSHADEAKMLTVATFNTEGDTSGSLPALLPILRDLNADVIALEEVDYADRRKLAHELAEEYPYQVFAIQARFDMIGILSRYPILESTIPSNRDFTRPDPDSPRYLRAVLDYQGEPIAVYVFHPMRPNFRFFLDYDDAANRLNLQQLLTALSAETYPTLVLCDCNTSPRTEQYTWLAKNLNDLHAERGWGLGLTHTGLPWLPFRNTRIDYIWYSAEFSPLESRVWAENGGSDHSPLWGRLYLP